MMDCQALGALIRAASLPVQVERSRWWSPHMIVGLVASGLMIGTANTSFAESIPEIQGGSHVSPLLGQTLTTKGVVTAVDQQGFFMQDPVGDQDDLTSDGIFVFVADQPGVEIGQLVDVTGTVDEFIPGGADTGNLSTTQIIEPTISVLSSGNALPSPVIIGENGRVPPARDVISPDEIDPPINLQLAADAGNNVFDPDRDGIDFFESLEGMRVVVESPVAVSPTRTFNAFSSELFTLPSDGRLIDPPSARTSRGAILLQADPDNRGDQNPERVQIQFDPDFFPGEVPVITVGDRMSDVTGVVGYSFGNFEVNATETFEVQPRELADETTRLRGNNKFLTIASYNVLNLSPDDSDVNQMATVAAHIATNLNSPDIVALQEIQDNSGELDDGTVDATETLQALRDAVVAAGGPVYEFVDVAPEDGASGGVPGGNIRNAFFYNPERVDLLLFDTLSSDNLTTLGASNPAAFEGTRDPLVGVFRFNGNDVVVVNNHLTSRFGSSPVYGGPQPFVQAGEEEREAQVAALNELAERALDIDANANIVILGDLNTFQFTNDLLDILPGEDNRLTNLIPAFGSNRGSDRDNIYTFNFEGNVQVLDHIFVSEGARQNAKLDIVHVNVDFPRVDDSVGSDHEPLVARLRLSDSTLNLQLSGISASGRDLAQGLTTGLFGNSASDQLDDQEVEGGETAGNDPLEGAGSGNDLVLPSIEPEVVAEDFHLEGYDTLVLADEFGGASLDRSKWCTRLPFGGGPALQIPDAECTKFIGQGTGDYANEPENQRFRDINNLGQPLHVVSNGTIKLRATNTSDRQYQPFEAAALRSKFVFKPDANTSYYITSRVILPEVLGIWPAFYLNPSLEPAGQAQWPPEVDIFEAPINGSIGENVRTLVQHAQVQGAQTDSGGSEWTFGAPGFNTDWGFWTAEENLRNRWIEIGAEWTENQVCYFVDGLKTGCENYRWVTNDGTPGNPATVVMFLAVGGPWAGKNGINYDAFPTALVVDHIRVYRKSS